MPATFMLVFVIFVDPCLVKRTMLFLHPSVSDEALARSSYGAATNCSGWARSDRQLPAAECTPRQAIPLRTTTRYTMALLQGWAKRSVPALFCGAWARRSACVTAKPLTPTERAFAHPYAASNSKNHSRGGIRPSCALDLAPQNKEGAGKAGCRPHPMALRAK